MRTGSISWRQASIATCTCASLDLRGHGDSDWADPPAYAFEDYASDVAAVVEKLDLRDFVLVGHSMGGMVSLVYAATYPGVSVSSSSSTRPCT